MGDLSNLLDREANRIAAKPDALAGVHRRAARRHRSRQIVAGVTALALVAGVGLGAWTILGDDPRRTRPGEQSPSSAGSEWPGIWPHSTRADAEEAQAAAERDPEQQWQFMSGEVAERYMRQVHGWDAVHFDDSLDGEPSEPVTTLYAATCDTSSEDTCRDAAIAQGRAQQEVLLRLEQLVRQGRDGVWTVTAIHGPSSMDRRVQPGWGRIPAGSGADCPAGDLLVPTETAVREAAEALMNSANAAQPDTRAVWDLLDPVTQAQFAPYELFAYHLRTAPAAPYDQWRVEYVGPDYPSDLQVAQDCGQDVRDATMAAEVTFPNDPMAHATLVFVGHADGVRFWMTS